MVTITICSNVECSNVKNIKGDCCPECGAKFIKIGMKELLNLIQNKNNTDPKKLPKSGFIACEKCGGYYKLKSGEYSANFTDKCDCGGKLIYINNIDVFKKNVTSKSEQTKNKVEPIAKQNDDENETKSIRSGGLLTNKKWYIIQENQRGKGRLRHRRHVADGDAGTAPRAPCRPSRATRRRSAANGWCRCALWPC